MKLRIISRLALPAFVFVLFLSSCVKEGPMGLTGPAGADGKDGKDANESCKMCHSPASVDAISVQFQLSKHKYGEAAFEEAGSPGCTPCHAEEAFKDIVKRDVQPIYTLDPNGKYSLKYNTSNATAYGELGCATCHSAIHATYGSSDLPSLTTVKKVPMVMWGAAKTIDLKADGGLSNLCVKCHQPRPQNNLQTGNVQDYVAIANNPTVMAYDANNNSSTANIVRPSYRMHLHYGGLGAIYAGMGGVEFPGTLAYTSSTHTTDASCKDCHMGAMYNRAGGHTFTAKGNLKTCNATGCHSSEITSSDPTYWVNPRKDIADLLNALAAKLTVAGVEIMNQSDDTEANLWYALTAKHYDGYLNVYDVTLNNPVEFKTANETGPFQNPTQGSAWTAAQKAYNLTLPKLSLTNAQYGAIMNFQLCLRDYSLGIHNYKYTKALLTNSIAKL